jgi:hypothetical protein
MDYNSLRSNSNPFLTPAASSGCFRLEAYAGGAAVESGGQRSRFYIFMKQ